MTTPSHPPVFGRTRAPDETWLARAVPEPALEPDLPIIDAHHHFWDRPGNRYFVEEFARDIAASGHKVVATVAEECGAMYRADGPAHLRSIGETEFFVGMAAMAASGKYTPCRMGASIVAHADLTQGELVREALEAHRSAANGRLGGVRHTGKWDPDPAVRGQIGPGRPGLYLEPEFGRGLDVLAAMDLVLDTSIYHPQIGDVLQLARSHPQARIVVIHCATPLGFAGYAGKLDAVHAEWLAGMKQLATCPNVHVKLGGLMMNLGNFDFTQEPAPPSSERLAALWRPWIEPCIELFGAGRCMVASNFPVDKAGATYDVVWNMYKRITAGCSADEKRLIHADTARRVYRIA